MNMNELPRGQLNPTILSTMVNGDKYGYEIIDEIKEKTGVEIKQPSLYSSLKRMETQKLVNSYWKDSAIGGKRHYYCLTSEGRKFLEENPVDYSLFTPIKEKETNNLINDENIKQNIETNQTTVVLNTSKPSYSNNNTAFEINNNEEIKLAEQENLFDLEKQKTEPKKEEIKIEQTNNISENQFNLFKEVDSALDDGRFITETIDDYNFPKIQKFEPANLNIESRDTSYLNAKIKNKEINKSNQNQKQYQEKITDLLITKLTLPYDHEKSMEKIQHKIDKFEAEKRQKEIANQKNHIKNLETEKVAIKKDEEYVKNENIFEKDKINSRIFNSYKSLESHYTSKGIGFKEYQQKEASSNFYVNHTLIKLINSFMFFLLSLSLAFGFFFGLKSNSIGEIIYIIIPAFALLIVILHFYLYKREKYKKIIQIKKYDTSTLVLPMIAVALVLVIIGINLIVGFKAEKTMEFFPVLIYPIILACYFGLIPYINKFIAIIVRKLREKFKYHF